MTGRLQGREPGDCEVGNHVRRFYSDLPETVLEEAARIVDSDRQEAYGPPDVDLARTGRIWGAILGTPDIPAATVALMMVGVKMSRQVHRPARDNLVDGCGYLRCIEKIEDAG